jgi:hypothetical protein
VIVHVATPTTDRKSRACVRTDRDVLYIFSTTGVAISAPSLHRSAYARSCAASQEKRVIDLVFIAVIAGFFGASVGLVAFCARLSSNGRQP